MSIKLVNNLVASRINRKVTVFQPGVGRKEIQSTAATYGELKEDILAAGFTLKDSMVDEGISQLRLVNDGAQLPRGHVYKGNETDDLIILITPKEKPKSGSDDHIEIVMRASHSQLVAFVSDLRRSAMAEEAIEHFGNHTHLPTTTLREKVIEWNESMNRLEEQSYVTPEADVNDTDSMVASAEEVIPFNADKYKEGMQLVMKGIKMLNDDVFLVGKGIEISDDELLEMYDNFKNV